MKFVEECCDWRSFCVKTAFYPTGVALGISFAYGWHLTLLTMAFIPFLVLGGFLEFSLVTGQEEVEKEANEEAGSTVFSRIITLVSLFV